MKTKPQKEAKKVQKSLYLTNEVWDKIQKKANQERRSINNFLEILIEKEIA